MDNTVVTLRRSSHVYKIDLWESSGSESERISTAMQPEMVAHLQFGAYDAWISFSSGSVAGPRCDISCWNAFHFRDYRNCFCVELQLYGIPPSGYLFFLPEVMVTCFSTLTSLESQCPPLPTSFILPLSRIFSSEEPVNIWVFVARIDDHRLSYLHTIFFSQVDF